LMIRVILLLLLRRKEEFLLDRARAYLETRQWKKAIDDVDSILRFNQKNSDAWKVKAIASKQLHEPSKAKLYDKKAKECQKQPRSLLED